MSYDIQAAFGKRTKLNCLNTIEICIPSGNVRMMSEVYFIFGIYLEYFFGQNKYIFDSVVCRNVESVSYTHLLKRYNVRIQKRRLR